MQIDDSSEVYALYPEFETRRERVRRFRSRVGSAVLVLAAFGVGTAWSTWGRSPFAPATEPTKARRPTPPKVQNRPQAAPRPTPKAAPTVAGSTPPRSRDEGRRAPDGSGPGVDASQEKGEVRDERTDAPARAPGPVTPEEVLVGLGLKKVGTRYLLVAAEESIAKLAIALGRREYAYFLQVQLASGIGQHDDWLQIMESERRLVENQIREVSRFIDGHFDARTIDYLIVWNCREGLKQYLQDLNLQIRHGHQRAAPGDLRRKVGEELKERHGDLLVSMDEIGGALRELKGRYAQLKADPRVSPALKALGESKKAHLTLGPSKQFVDIESYLVKLSRRVPPR